MATLTIPVSGPSITQKEIAYVTDAVTNAWYGNANMYHTQFEQAFAKYVNTKHAMALPSCTSAIHLALLALGVGEGDEVIIPECTWIASAAPIAYVGATPVFADIDPLGWCLSPQSFKERITSRTKAVIPVDLYGNMPDMDAIRAIASEHRIAVIEDAAEAIGSEYKGTKSGSLGDVGVFSFHGSKTLTTGEGGMLVTDRDDVFARASVLRDHGRKPGDTMFFNSEIGYKYKMSSMQAALGLAQLERIDELIAHKRQIFSWYREELDDLEGITLNYEAPNTKSTYWMNTIVLDAQLNLSKEKLIEQLRADGIDCRPFFYPLSALPAYSNHAQAKTGAQLHPHAYQISSHAANLPSGMNMTFDLVRQVCDSLKARLKRDS